jgi:hypothetical protein
LTAGWRGCFLSRAPLGNHLMRRTNLNPRLTGGSAFALAALIAVLCATPACATIPQGNLVQNPGAEASPGVTDDTTHVCPAAWSCTNNATVVRYGTSAFPSLAESARIGGGQNFFAGGPNDDVGDLQGSFDFSAAGPEVDAGGVQATLSACLGGFQDQEDRAFVSVEERDSSNIVRDTKDVEGPNATVRGGQTRLLPVSATFQVPPHARFATLRVFLSQTGPGTYDDGYADNISFTLGPFPGAIPPAERCAASPPAIHKKKCKKPHKRRRHAAEAKKHKRCKKRKHHRR